MVVVALIVSWWHGAVDLGSVIGPRYFSASGIAIVGYSIFAFTLGVLFGALLRRTLAAAAATAAGFGLMRWWVQDALRPHYLTPLVYQRSVSSVGLPPAGWVLTFGMASARGASPAWVQRSTTPRRCVRTRPTRPPVHLLHRVSRSTTTPASPPITSSTPSGTSRRAGTGLSSGSRRGSSSGWHSCCSGRLSGRSAGGAAAVPESAKGAVFLNLNTNGCLTITGEDGGRNLRQVIRGVIAVAGRVLVAAGVLVLLFAVFQLWGTGLFEAHDQSALRSELTKALPHDAMDRAARIAAHPPKAKTASGRPAIAPPASAPADGQPIGTIQIPNIGLDQVVVEGVGTTQLEMGPGHYPGTPLPGEQGNVAIAGHRTTYAHPFYDLNDVTPGNTILLTTAQGIFVYTADGQQVVQPTDVA